MRTGEGSNMGQWGRTIAGTTSVDGVRYAWRAATHFPSDGFKKPAPNAAPDVTIVVDIRPAPPSPTVREAIHREAKAVAASLDWRRGRLR
jgi:hypothetical protein